MTPPKGDWSPFEEFVITQLITIRDEIGSLKGKVYVYGALISAIISGSIGYWFKNH